MKKHKVAYVDENNRDIQNFQRRVYEILDVLPFFPKPDIDEFVEELLTSGAEAFIVDFRLNEYRTDVEYPINYDGTEVVEKILAIRKGFPCFVLTSYDGDAIQKTSDVNYVYPKNILVPEKQPGQTSFGEKIRIQIEHYQTSLENKTNRFLELLEKSEKTGLSEAEENELLKIDSFLEKSINNHDALPDERKKQFAIEKIDNLLASTHELLAHLRGEKE